MKYEYPVKHDGVLYQAGQEVPVEKAAKVEKVEKPVKKSAKKDKE